MNRNLIALNRRLDAVFEEMEISWAIYQVDKSNPAKLRRYVRALRRAATLHELLKSMI